MRVVNSQKERSKNRICNDIDRIISRVNMIESDERDVISIIDNTIGGALSGIDKEIIAKAQSIYQDTLYIKQLLGSSSNIVNHLDVTEEVPDE